MKYLRIILIAAILFIGGTTLAATITADFPTSLNNWSDGDIIEEEDLEAIQVKIGINDSAVATSLDYLIKNTSSKLGKIASLAVTDSNFLVADGTNWTVESGTTARTSLGLGTGDSPQFTGIELGHATDTTLTRASAGVMNVEGSALLTSAGIDTSAELLAILTDETGTGLLTFATLPNFTTGITINAGDVADAGGIRLLNAENIAWEAAPTGTDMTLGVDASEILQYSGVFNATSITEATIGVLNNDEIDASSELLAIMDDETGTGLLTFATAPVFTTNIDIAAAGVRLSAAAGVITLLGLGPGFDENLILDLDTITNVGTFTSGTLLATLNFSGIGLQESGSGVVSLGEIDTYAELDAIVADAVLTHNGLIDTSAELLTIVGDETGTGVLVFGTSPTFTTDITFPLLSIEAGAYGAATIDGDDIASSLAGRSLTLTAAAPDTLDADVELYTDLKTLWFETPTAADDFKTIWVAPLAVTITKIHCESDQTVVFDLSNDDGTPIGVNGSDITCTTFATDSVLAGDTLMAAGDRLDLALTSVSGTPTWFSVSWEFTLDD